MKPHIGGTTETPPLDDEGWVSAYSGSGEMQTNGETAAWIDPEDMSSAELLAEAGVEPIVSTSEAAEYFDKTSQWIYWGLKPDPETGKARFTWPDGSEIVPERIGEGVNSRRRFTTPILRAILTSCYRRGTVTDDELKVIIRRIRYTELGVEWREREGWKRVHLGRKRYRWVKPELAYRSEGEWKLRKAKK